MEDSLISARSVLVLGGARSGKSAFAQSLAEGAASERLYLATAAAGDAEMAERIARHQADRGAGWTTLEEPLALAEALAVRARPGFVVLVDCLTLWLSNLMFGGPRRRGGGRPPDRGDRRARGPGCPGLQRGWARARAGDEARPGVPRLAGPGESGGR